MVSRVFINNQEELVPGTVELPVTEPLSLNYGTVRLSFVVPSLDSDEGSVLVPEKDLAHVLDRGVPYARRYIQNRAVPALEELVERHGARITVDNAVVTAVTESLLYGIDAKVSCAVTADVEEEEVQEVLRAQVLKPLQREIRQESEPVAPSRSLLARVQGLIRSFGSPVRR